MSYYSYMTSSEWRFKAGFMKLVACLYRLSPLPLFGQAHHTHYRNIYHEVYLRDIIVVGYFVHMLILHGILSGFKSAGEQGYNYPNKAQRIVHVIYMIPGLGGATILLALHIIGKLFLQLEVYN